MASHSGTAHAPSPSSTDRHANNPFRAYQLYQRAEYPKQVWYFVGGGIGLFILANIYHVLRTRSRRASLLKGASANGSTNGKNGPISWRRLPAAIETAFRIAAFRWTIPYGRNHVLSLTELLCSILYAGALLTWSFINSNGGVKTFWNQRTAAIAFQQIPLLPLLAGKNNLIGLLTGLSYEKLNIMHRTVGRVSFILMMVHSFSKAPSYTSARLLEEKYLTGTISATAFGILFLFSLRPVRKGGFEFFLIMHIILVIIYLVTAYLHQRKHAKAIFLAFGFWGLDRIIRGLKLIFINKGKSTPIHAKVEVVGKDAVRLTVENRHMYWNAGQHAFLTFPNVSKLPFESHPFTIASIRDRESKDGQDLVFIIRAMDGLTRRLYAHATESPNVPVGVLVDGPYGRPPKVNTYSTVVLLAGGSGVSFTLPLLQDIVSSVRKGESPVKKVVFIWSIKTKDELKWASEELNSIAQNIPSSLSVDIRVHVTRVPQLDLPSLTNEGSREPSSPLSPISSPSSPFDEKSTDSIGDHKSGSQDGFTVTEKAVDTRAQSFKLNSGRANLQAIVEEEIEASTGPVSINVAGPFPFTAAIRGFMRSEFVGPIAVLRGRQPVSFYTENFGDFRSQ